MSRVMTKPAYGIENKDVDKIPRNLICTFVVRCLDSMVCIFAIAKVSRF